MSNDEDEIVLLDDTEKNENNNESTNIIHSNDLAMQSAGELESELAKFRSEWKKELERENNVKTSQKESETQCPIRIVTTDKANSNKSEFMTKIPTASLFSQEDENLSSSESTQPDLAYQEPKTNEEKAKYLFEKGVLLEQQGRYYEAVKFYRMSMQLDADIEFKVATQRLKNLQLNEISNENVKDARRNKNSTSEDNQQTSEETLYQQFQTHVFAENQYCEKNFPQKATHFSQLPLEVIMLILKWVVSDQLDMRSLENFGSVCKGFYVCARDPEIWRLACCKLWGSNNLYNYLPLYSDWRTMFLKRPHLNFDGVYISKASYARAGEQSLDSFYRPWHLVEYYRYFRFFPDGTVLFLTTPDEPKITVSKLKLRTTNPSTASNTANIYSSFILNDHSILKGKWTLDLSMVYITICKKINKPAVQKYSRRQMNKEPPIDQEHIFKIEMQLVSSEKRLNNQLHWSNYEIQISNKTTNTVNITKFDLNKIDFPSFYFSRVRSYSSNSECVLK